MSITDNSDPNPPDLPQASFSIVALELQKLGLDLERSRFNDTLAC